MEVIQTREWSENVEELPLDRRNSFVKTLLYAT